MSSYKDMAELAGYTSRVYTLLSTLHELDVNHYQSLPRPAEHAFDQSFYDLGHINGVLVTNSEDVEFDKVPIVAPAPGLARGGEELVKTLSVIIKPGDHLLITGANVGGSKTYIGFNKSMLIIIKIILGNGQDEFCQNPSELVACVRRSGPKAGQRRNYVSSSKTLSKPWKPARPVSSLLSHHCNVRLASY